MRNFRRLVLGLVLVILSPLGWGEGIEWLPPVNWEEAITFFCVDEVSIQITTNDNGTHVVNEMPFSKMKVDIHIEEQVARITGKYGSRSWLQNLDCKSCYSDGQFFELEGKNSDFEIVKSKFYSVSTNMAAYASAGTCTKF